MSNKTRKRFVIVAAVVGLAAVAFGVAMVVTWWIDTIFAPHSRIGAMCLSNLACGGIVGYATAVCVNFIEDCWE